MYKITTTPQTGAGCVDASRVRTTFDSVALARLSLSKSPAQSIGRC